MNNILELIDWYWAPERKFIVLLGEKEQAQFKKNYGDVFGRGLDIVFPVNYRGIEIIPCNKDSYFLMAEACAMLVDGKLTELSHYGLPAGSS